MSLASRLRPASVRGKALAVLAGLLLLTAVWQLLRAWWYHGYARGTRSGVLRSFAYTGSPLCRFWSGELLLTGSNPTRPEVWKFAVEGPPEGNPTALAIQQAEARAPGRPLTLIYRQDKGRWWSCIPTEYFVTGVFSADPAGGRPGAPSR